MCFPKNSIWNLNFFSYLNCPHEKWKNSQENKIAITIYLFSNSKHIYTLNFCDYITPMHLIIISFVCSKLCVQSSINLGVFNNQLKLVFLILNQRANFFLHFLNYFEILRKNKEPSFVIFFDNFNFQNTLFSNCLK